MPVRLLIAALAVVAVGLFALGYVRDESAFAIAGAPVFLVAAALFVLRPQLEWRYYRRRPSDLDAPLVGLFDAKLPAYYREGSAEERLRFRQETFLAERALDFRGQGFGDAEVPADLAALVASQLARVTAADPETHVLPPFENVVLYRHAFPSPQHPETWHHSELYAEDGVLIFNLERAVPGIFEPHAYFNVVLYEWCRVAALTGFAPTPARDAERARDWAGVCEREARRPGTWVTEAVGLGEELIDGAAVLRVLRMEGLLAAAP